jgi:adenylate kinase
VAGVCDLCGTALVQRSDDKPETVRARLVVYHGNTQLLIPYYRDQGLLREADGTGAIEVVYANIMKALNPQANKSC